MPSSGGSTPNTPSPPRPDFSGFRSSSVERIEGIHQSVQLAVQRELNKFRTDLPASTPRAPRRPITDIEHSLSYSDISVAGVNRINNTPSDGHRRLDSLATVFSQEGDQTNNGENFIELINIDLFDQVNCSCVNEHHCDSALNAAGGNGENNSENTIHSTGDSRPESAASTNTVVPAAQFVAPPPPLPLNKTRVNKTAMKKNSEAVKRCLFVWDNNYKYLNPKTVPLTQLDTFSSELSTNVTELTNAILYFSNNPADAFTEEQNRLANDCLSQFNTFRKTMYDECEVRRNERPPPPYNASAEIEPAVIQPVGQPSGFSAVARQRVQNGMSSVKDHAGYVIRGYKELYKSAPTSSLTLKGCEVTFKQTLEQQRECQRTIDELIKCASSCGDLTSVQTLDEISHSMGQYQRNTRGHLDNCYQDMGLTPGIPDAGVNRAKIAAPVFSGEYTAGSMDFYTFKMQLDQYFDIHGGFNDFEKCYKLKNNCVTGRAKDAIISMESYEEAMKHLQQIFGKPELLFASKAHEIKSRGSCPDTIYEKRDWVIDVEQKLAALRIMAKKHHMEDLFESSNVLGILMGALTKDDSLEFNKKLINARRLNPDVRQTKTMMIRNIADFLKNLIFETSLNLDIVVTSGAKGFHDVKRAMKPSGARSSHKYSVMPGESDNVLDLLLGVSGGGGGGEDDGGAIGDTAIDGVHVHNAEDKSKSAKSKSKKTKSKPKSNDKEKNACVMMNKSSTPKSVYCKLCKGEHTSLAYCLEFQKAPVKKRFGKCIKARACYQCLRLDSNFDMDNRESWFNEHKPFCNDKWLCKVEKCSNKDPLWMNHVLVCTNHFETNMEREPEFKASLDQKLISSDVRFYFASYHALPCEEEESVDCTYAAVTGCSETVVEPEVKGSAIYMLQYVQGRDDEKLLVFYDSGCYSSTMSDRAYSSLDTVTVRSGPTTLHIAGGLTIDLPYGEEKYWLQLFDEGGRKKLATFRGLRMCDVSGKFPEWQLQEVWKELALEYAKICPGVTPPAVESAIGGEAVDIMVGIKYAQYYPELLFSLPSGLSLYKAKLKGYGGMQGVLGGPHDAWKNVMSSTNFIGPAAFLTSEFKAYKYQSESLWSNIGPFHVDEPESGVEHVHTVCQHYNNPFIDEDERVVSAIFAAGPGKLVKEYQLLDEIGAEMGYRCVKCRVCPQCRKGDKIEQVSLLEEQEQFQIEQSLEYDPVQKKVLAVLPFNSNPEKELADNTYIAEKILGTQLKIANKSDSDKEAILKSFKKLSDKGHIVPLTSLPPEEQKLAQKSGYTIPWRLAYKEQSISSPVRPVFDASSRTKSGKSLNDILCKGSNQLSNILHLLISFRCGAAALSADVKMAYNAIALKPEHYRYQKFLWVDGLSLLGAVAIWIVRTLIYGVKSSGNQTIHGFTVVASEAEKAEPELKDGADTLRKFSYVDDILRGFVDAESRDKAAESLLKVLDYGQMEVKAITKSGYVPEETVSVDGETVGLIGYCWRPEEDTISLEIKYLFLGKAKRGKLPVEITSNLKEALAPLLTKRILLGKVMSVYDPLGLAVPWTSKFKVDMSLVVQHNSDWDDLLPVDQFLDTWVENLELTQSLRDFRFQRSVFNYNVDVEHGVELIVCTDASQVLAATCVHARMKLLTGGYVVSLVAAKSKLVSKPTVPKAELIACSMGSVLSHLVKLNFGDYVTKTTLVTDSVVALYWMHCDSRPLQTGVRNLVIECRRFTDLDDWNHIESALNLADIGTRPDSLPDIGSTSEWQMGKEWMRGKRDDMPIKNIDEITMDQTSKNEALKEMRSKESRGMVLANYAGKMTERFALSKYVINPCKISWGKYIRAVATLYKIVDIWKQKTPKLGFVRDGCEEPARFEQIGGKVLVAVDDQDTKRAEKYVYSKTTEEVQKYNCQEKLKKVGKLKDNILVHHGRILPGGERDLSAVMLDLHKLAFAKPVLDRYSPCSYSIMKFCHEKVTNHGGIKHTLRRSLEIAFILKGESLATEIRNNCLHCKRYDSRLVKVEFGPVDPDRLKVAPAFTICSIDLFGPVSARCGFGRHKDQLKMWAAVYKCPTTLAVAAYCMTGYDTESFLQTVTRHINRYGVPAKVKIDSGTQLISAFKEADFCVAEVHKLLEQTKGCKVEYETCPVGGHNYNGVVERSIKSIKRVLGVVFRGAKFTPIDFETALNYVCNELNSMPLCLGSKYKNFDCLDLITPSRLLLGRNNVRAPGGQLTVDRPKRILESMELIEQSWWDAWKELRIADFVPKPNKWHTTTENVKVGDIVTFTRDADNPLGTCIFRIGRVRAAPESRDGKVRAVDIEYRNFGEKELRVTHRAVRTISVVFKEGEVDFVGDLGDTDVEATFLLMVRKYST